jgi:hypothetical protein
MNTESEARAFTRREAVGVAVAGLAGATFLPSCRGIARDVRAFRVGRAFTWEPSDFLHEVAFSFVSERVVDYVDGLCDGCGAGARFFLFAVDVAATAVTITCPECSMGTRLAVALTRELVAEMAVQGFARAVGFIDGPDGYIVKKVAPVVLQGTHLSVARSAVCYGVQDREPTSLFDRQISAFPERICYFTEVAAAPGHQIVHVWRRNGEVTDRIPLEANSGNWRTWSHKENLARGSWIVTTELRSGEVLGACAAEQLAARGDRLGSGRRHP